MSSHLQHHWNGHAMEQWKESTNALVGTSTAEGGRADSTQYLVKHCTPWSQPRACIKGFAQGPVGAADEVPANAANDANVDQQ